MHVFLCVQQPTISREMREQNTAYEMITSDHWESVRVVLPPNGIG